MRFWVENITEDIINKINKSAKVQVIATGITPSGPIHLGNMREVVTANAIFEMFGKLKKPARLLYIADNFDPLRNLYPFLPQKFSKYIGWPISKIPAPEGIRPRLAPRPRREGRYDQYFLKPFFESLAELGIELEVIYASELYAQGKMTKFIDEALEKAEEIRKILREVTNPNLPNDWMPLNPLCANCGRIDRTKVSGFDTKKHIAQYHCEFCGHEAQADYSKGEAKLPWRVDWPARWALLGVTIEPFGKDHAAPGGSYQSGKRICEEVFGKPAPYPIAFEYLHLKGEGVMHSSLGRTFAASDLLKIVPPPLIRYFLIRNKPSRHLDFDPGRGLIQIVEEYRDLEDSYFADKINPEEKVLYELTEISRGRKTIPFVPMSHLVMTIQAAMGDFREVKRLLKRSEHKDALEDEELLKTQIERVKNWLDNFAPAEWKFTIQQKMPKTVLNKKQREFLGQISADLSKKDFSAEELHNHLYNTGKDLGLDPRKTFGAIYKVLLGRDSGPKAGWFLSMMDKDFLIKRFKEAARA